MGKKLKLQANVADAGHGIDVAGLPVEEAAARVRARPAVALALVAALDDWALFRSQNDKAGGEALTEVAQATDSDPWRRQVREARKLKDTKALAALAASPQLLRQPPTSLLVLAKALRARGLMKAEIEVLRQAQRQHPGDFWINFDLGWALDHPGPHSRDEAISFYRAALAARPQNIAVHINLGTVFLRQGKLDDANACFRRAIDLDAMFTMAHDNLGIVLWKQGKLQEAIAAHHRAIEIDSKYFRAYYHLANSLLDQKKPDEAIASCRKAIELEPRDPFAHYNLGRGLIQKGFVDEAIVAFREAIRFKLAGTVERNYAAYWLNQSAWGLATSPDPRLRDGKRAVELVKEAIAIKPNDWMYWNTLGAAHYRAASWREAVTALEKSMELRKGGDSHDWFFLAMAHWQLGNKKEAEKWHAQAVEWMDKHQPKNEELRRFRTEAADLLGIEKKKD